LGEWIASEGELSKLQGWRLYRMAHTPRPLEERATLLWHNHFATSVEKVVLQSLMFRQNQLLRRHAWAISPTCSRPSIASALSRTLRFAQNEQNIFRNRLHWHCRV